MTALADFDSLCGCSLHITNNRGGFVNRTTLMIRQAVQRSAAHQRSYTVVVKPPTTNRVFILGTLQRKRMQEAIELILSLPVQRQPLMQRPEPTIMEDSMQLIQPGLWVTGSRQYHANDGKKALRKRESRLARQRRRFGKRIERAISTVVGRPFHGQQFIGSSGDRYIDFGRMNHLLHILGNTSMILDHTWCQTTMGELKGRLLELLWEPSVDWLIFHDDVPSDPLAVDQETLDNFASEFL